MHIPDEDPWGYNGRNVVITTKKNEDNSLRVKRVNNNLVSETDILLCFIVVVNNRGLLLGYLFCREPKSLQTKLSTNSERFTLGCFTASKTSTSFSALFLFNTQLIIIIVAANNCGLLLGYLFVFREPKAYLRSCRPIANDSA